MKTTYLKSRNGQEAITHLGNWHISTRKNVSRPGIRCRALLCDELGHGIMRFSSDSPTHELATSQGKATAAEIKRVHDLGLREFAKLYPEFAAEISPGPVPLRASSTPSPVPPPPPKANTPWGKPDTITDYGTEGIRRYDCPGHGGFHVPEECLKRMPAPYRVKSGWYEEDCEWAKVALSFPDLFSPESMACARRTAINWFPHEFMAVTGEAVDPQDSHVLAKELFQQASRDSLVVLTAWGSGRTVHDRPDLPPVPDGMVGVRATLGGDRSDRAAEHYRLVPEEEYDRRGPHGFIVQDSHPEWRGNIASTADRTATIAAITAAFA